MSVNTSSDSACTNLQHRKIILANCVKENWERCIERIAKYTAPVNVSG